jgi:S1-C subfamily serine protease
VTDLRQLLEVLDAKHVGDSVAVEVQRGVAQRLTFKVTLADRAPGRAPE